MPNDHELLPIDPIESFLTLKQAALCNKVPKVSPCSKHTASTLRITASTFCLIFLFLDAEPNFPFNNEEIDDTDPTDCKESSQQLEEDVSTWSRASWKAAF